MDPGMQRELHALDAALAGEPVDGELAGLADLAVDLRAERPVPPEEFIEALDARAAAGFAQPQHTIAPQRRRRRVTPLVAATGAAVFIAVVAIVSSNLFSSDGGGEFRSKTSQAEDQASSGDSSAPTPQRQASPSLSVPTPVPGGGTAPTVRPRKVEQAASITLAAPRNEVEDVADGVIRTADRYGGFVLHSSVSAGDRNARAKIDLRIPSSRLTDAIADLSELAHVRSRSQRADDITARFSYPRRELADATGERRALLAQLARATTPNETASIRARLQIVNDRIDTARATLRRLQNRVTYASIAVAVEEGAPAADDGGSWSAGDAWGSALDVLRVSFGVLVVGLAGLVPLTLLLALAYAGRRAFLGRARNAALDAVEKVPTR